MTSRRSNYIPLAPLVPPAPGQAPSPAVQPSYHWQPLSTPYVPYRQRLRTTVPICLTKQDLKDRPWKFLGYRAFSKWSASSDDALIIRRFNQLNARVLLFMQDEIVQIENDLEELDKRHMTASKPHLHNGELRHEHEPQRTDLLGLLVTKLKAYNDFLLSHRHLRADPEAPTRSVENVTNFLHDCGALKNGSKADGSIAEAEMKYVETAGDLVSLVPKVKAPLRRFLDQYGAWHRFILFWRFKVEPNEYHHYQFLYPSTTTFYHNDANIDRLMTFVVTAVGLGGLLGALWALKVTVSLADKLWIITGFLVGFVVFLGVATVARPFETLAATAAVAAVLMVFVQVGPEGNK